MKRRTTTLLAALAVLGTAGPLAPTILAAATPRQDPPATQPATSPATAPADLSDAAVLAQILHDPASTPDQRELAAARLLANATDPAIEHLARALRSSAPAPVQTAAAVAVAASGMPEPRLLEPLLALLATDGPVSVKREVGRALGNFREDPTVVARLTELAVTRSSTPTRQGAVAGLARVPAKESAQALMLLLDGDAPEPLERDAAEALRSLTGLDIAPDDLAGWQAWWEGAAALDETQFKAELVDSRAQEAIASARRADSAVAALLAVSRQRFRALATADQPAMLLEYLRSPNPEMREVGAEIVREEADFGEDIAPEVMRLVRAGIADPSGRVRTLAAIIVQRRNDASAVEPLLAQVSREPVLSARLAQIRALGSLRDGRALTMLLGLLTDPSPGVRSAAARSAAELANVTGTAAVAQASGAIRQAFQAVDPSNQSGQRQRFELVSALAELKDPALADFYRGLLTGPSRPSRDVRAAALRGMATLGNETRSDTSDTIVMFVGDEDAKVREEAVRALARSSRGFERVETLLGRLNPRSESSEAVRQAAWQALLTVLPRADIEKLNGLATDFAKAGEPERQLAVLRIIAAKEEAAGNFEQLAWWRHQMADVHLGPLNGPSEAANLYRQALQYSLENGGTPGTIQNRAKNALRAYLRSRRFDEGIAFAREMIGRDPGFEEQVGAIVKEEAQSLADQGHTDAARSLISAVLRQDPPLLARDRRSRQQLQEQLDKLPTSAPTGG